jgi:hypothetical protein
MMQTPTALRTFWYSRENPGSVKKDTGGSAMKTPSRMSCGRAIIAVLLTTAMLACPSSGYADETSAGFFTLRNQNPFLQIYGLPTFQTAVLVDKENSAWDLSLDLANHADFGNTDSENFVVDGETYFLTLSMRRRVADWLELGFDLPLVSHADGFMDDMIEGWHDIFGMSNTKRRGPSNELGFLYQRNGEDLYRLESAASGLGDLQLTAAIPLRESVDGRSRVAIRSSVKLPTGDADKLLGSGSADFSAGVYATGTSSMLGRSLVLNGFVGGLVPGEGDVLPTLLHEVIAYGGASAAWQATERIVLTAQLYGQAPYYDSDVEELGGNSLQLTTGIAVRMGRDTLLRMAIVEDVSANATTDFAVHFSIRFGGVD